MIVRLEKMLGAFAVCTYLSLPANAVNENKTNTVDSTPIQSNMGNMSGMHGAMPCPCMRQGGMMGHMGGMHGGPNMGMMGHMDGMHGGTPMQPNMGMMGPMDGMHGGTPMQPNMGMMGPMDRIYDKSKDNTQQMNDIMQQIQQMSDEMAKIVSEVKKIQEKIDVDLKEKDKK